MLPNLFFLLNFVLTVVLTSAICISGCMAIASLVTKLKANSIDDVKRTLISLLALTFFTAFFTIYISPTMLTGLLYFGSLFLTPEAIIVWLLMSIWFTRLAAGNKQVHKWFWVSGLSVIVFFSSPAVAVPTIDQACRALTHKAAQPLIMAVTEYQAEHGAWPSTLELLTPDYLPEIPVPPCSFLSGYYVIDGYRIYENILSTESVDGLSCEDYNLDEHRWSTIDFCMY